MYFVRELDPKERMMLRVGTMKKDYKQAVRLATRLAEKHKTYAEVYEDAPSNIIFVAVKDTAYNLAPMAS